MKDHHIKLIPFIKSYMREHKELNTAQRFANQYSIISGTDDSLSPSILSRLLHKKTKANAETLRKIAVIVLGRKNATVQDLWNEMNQQPLADEDDIVRIGTGFTTWSSYILSVINAEHDEEIKKALQGIRFVFCNEQTDGVEAPYWVKSPKDIEYLKASPGRFPHKYIARDLQDLLERHEIDCALLLGPTFEAMNFSQEQKPVLFSRILVGNGTQLYVIERNDKEKADNKIFEDSGKEGYASEAKAAFCSLIQNKHVRTIAIGNKTISRDMSRLFNDAKVTQVHTRSNSEKIINNVGDAEYNKYIHDIKQAFARNSTPEDPTSVDVLLVVAFAPLTHTIFRDLLAQDPTHSRLKYHRFNLSKMIEEKASYGMYARVDVVKNLAKLKKLRDFLKSIDKYVAAANTEELTSKISLQLSDLYYGDNVYDPQSPQFDNCNKLTKMQNDLLDLQYSNRSLPLIDILVDKLEEQATSDA